MVLALGSVIGTPAEKLPPGVTFHCRKKKGWVNQNPKVIPNPAAKQTFLPAWVPKPLLVTLVPLDDTENVGKLWLRIF